MELVEVPVTDTADAMLVENGKAVIVRVFNASDYHKRDCL